MHKILIFALLMISLLAMGCSQSTGGYVAASTFSQDGFARNAAATRALTGQEIKIWGYLDHGNLYGDEDAQEILGDWWSGDGPDENTWRFNLKANAADESGHSFAVHVPNDKGGDALLTRFAAAGTQTPTRVFVTGRLFTFDAPTNFGLRTGLYIEVHSSADILLDLPEGGAMICCQE